LTQNCISSVGGSICRERHSLAVLVGGDRVADVDVLETGQADDVAGDAGGGRLAAVQAGVFEHLGDLGADAFAVAVFDHPHRVGQLDMAAENLPTAMRPT